MTMYGTSMNTGVRVANCTCIKLEDKLVIIWV